MCDANSANFGSHSTYPGALRSRSGLSGPLGGILSIVTLSGAMPLTTSSGVAVSSYNAEAIVAGVCCFTYNRVEVVVRPINECRAFEKTASLVVAGGLLLFAAVGVWLAHLETGFEGRHEYKPYCIGPNNRFERSRGCIFVGPRRESMIRIKCLRLSLTKLRVAQPHR